eukprot:s2091_g2.t2
MDAFCVPTAKARALVDLHAYDGATGLAAVEERIFLNDAKEVTGEPDGRWFAFKLENTSKLVLEKKNIPDHLSSLECLDVPTTVDHVIRELEDEGEVKIRISHHTLKKSESTIAPAKDLVFVLDEPSTEAPKKKRKGKNGKDQDSTAGSRPVRDNSAAAEDSLPPPFHASDSSEKNNSPGEEDPQKKKKVPKGSNKPKETAPKGKKKDNEEAKSKKSKKRKADVEEEEDEVPDPDHSPILDSDEEINGDGDGEAQEHGGKNDSSGSKKRPAAAKSETVQLSPNCQFKLPEDSPTTRFCKWAQHVADDIGDQLEKLDTMVTELEKKEENNEEEQKVMREAAALTECARPLSPRCLDRLLSEEAMKMNADKDGSSKTAPAAEPCMEVEPEVVDDNSPDMEVENALKTPDREKEPLKSPEVKPTVPAPADALPSKGNRGKRAPLMALVLGGQDTDKAKEHDKEKNNEPQVEPVEKASPTGAQKKPTA